METDKLNYFYNKFKYGEDSYHYLMAKRVKEILLVSTFYDAFIFEQDGRLSEQIYGEYRQLNLSTAPKITSVPTGEDALEILQRKHFDMVISMLHIGKISPFELAAQIKQRDPDIPVILLLRILSDIKLIEDYETKIAPFDNVFLWKGDTKLFLAMVKSIEDRLNLEYDTKKGLVRVILLVEDSVQYYSLFLPLLYEEIMKQTQILIREELNDINKRLRMRARPKVILARNYEEALSIYENYKEYIIAVISDISYRRKGKIDNNAGIHLIKQVKKNIYDVPTILLSSDTNYQRKSEQVQTLFLDKYDKHLLHKLRRFIIDNLGFGDFIFRDNHGKEIVRARTLTEFEAQLKSVSNESLIYHSKRNHFSAWLMARGETQIAKNMRLLTVKDFDSIAEIRKHLLHTIKIIRQSRNRGRIIKFHPSNLKETDEISWLSEGSLGGKGRGLAFLNALLTTMEFDKDFPEVNISLPSTAIIGTNEYDDFIERNRINEKLGNISDNRQIKQLFIKGSLSPELIDKLKIYLKTVDSPLAVRSSGLLEDSYSQPFAGIYSTIMLPNNHPNLSSRLEQLQNAIKLVMASVFTQNARNYIESLDHQVEEEKMAVIIQNVIGAPFGEYFYPHISGIAQSYNFYPMANLKNEDGIATIAVGLGKAVIEGHLSWRFCPKYPQVQFLQSKAILKDTQQQVYALNMSATDFDLQHSDDVTIDSLSISTALKHGSLMHVASTWNAENHRLTPGQKDQGVPLITFENVLKYEYFPLAKIIDQLLEIGENAMGMPVEIEFAVDLTRDSRKGRRPAFYILQIRPMGVHDEELNLIPEEIKRDEAFIYTEKGMGNGTVDDIDDVIYVNPERFDKLETRQIQTELERLNTKMQQEGREYILIGQGRWGTQDRFLGIPVRFIQISNARIIIEMGMEDYNIDPSQGSHFFHNIIAMQIGYFSIPYQSKKDFIDWEWLRAQKIVDQTEHLIHARTARPLTIKMDGKRSIAVIYKPNTL